MNIHDLSRALIGIPENLVTIADSIKRKAMAHGGVYEGLSYFKPDREVGDPQSIIGDIVAPDYNLSVMLSWDRKKLSISKFKMRLMIMQFCMM